jgi:DNA-binding beta-propeller fold protein YncE
MSEHPCFPTHVKVVTLAILCWLTLCVAQASAFPPPVYKGEYGKKGGRFVHFNGPRAIAVDAAGYFYVADENNKQIVKFDAQENESWRKTLPPALNPNQPYAICVDGAGNVYVSDTSNNRVVKFDPQGGHISAFDTGSLLKTPAGLAVSPDGHIYVADVGHDRIEVLDSTNGHHFSGFGAHGNGLGEFDDPYSVAFNVMSGDIYVCDQLNNRIQRFNSAFCFLGSWGGQATADNQSTAHGQSTADGQFTKPLAVAVDRLGHVYVADTSNNRIQEFTSDGRYLTQVGLCGSGQADGRLDYPAGLAVDASCNVYIADLRHNRIALFSADCSAEGAGQAPVDAWLLNGNSGTDPDPSTKNSFLGTTDGKPLVIRAEGGVGIGVTDLDKSLGLDVRRRIRLRDGYGGETAGLYLNTAHSEAPGGRADIAFIGAIDKTRIGFFGIDPRTNNDEAANRSAWWGLTFDTVTGNVRIGDHKKWPSDVGYPAARFEVMGDSRDKKRLVGVRFMDQDGKNCDEWLPGQGWAHCSDRNAKERVTPVDPVSVLDAVSQLPLSEWSYKGYEERHIGPMAQDFNRMFPMGGSDKVISDINEQGVALAAIQGLNTMLQQKNSEIATLQKELKELERRMAALEGSAKASGH